MVEVSPLAELRKIKAADTAAASLMVDQRIRIRRGTENDASADADHPGEKTQESPGNQGDVNGRVRVSPSGVLVWITIRSVAMKRKMPRMILYAFGWIWIDAPSQAMGMEVMISGSRIFILKYPAR